MNTKEIKEHLAGLTDKQLIHCNGVDFAYFRPGDISALVAESELQTDLLHHLVEMCEIFQNNDEATDEDAYELSKGIIRTINAHLEGKAPEQTGDLWCVHIEGPDDILAMPSKDFAERVAANLNKGFDELKRDDIRIEAKVIPYPHTKESFDEGLDSWADLVAGDWG